MEEKERYKVSVGSDYITIYDYEENRIKALDNYGMQSLLNLQDKRIRELEEMNDILKRSKEHFKKVAENVVDLLEKLNKIIGEPQTRELNYCKVIEDTKSYIEKLKKSQKQLAVVQLEKVEEILWDSQDIGNLMDNDKFLEKLNYLIKSLKGE